jgi:NADH:ubiquinone oxidoreductase subunit E
MDADGVLAVLDKRSEGRGGLIAILQDIQARYNYLPADALRLVADRTGTPLVDVYGVATFYRSFSLKPRGRHLCSVCLGTACHVRGSQLVAEELERELKIRAGQTTPDGEFTLEAVNCLGACALGPIVVVDGRYHANVDQPHVPKLIKEARNGGGGGAARRDPRIFPVAVGCPRCNHSLMDESHPLDGYPSIRVTVSFQGVHTWLRLSSLYGSYTVEAGQDAPKDTEVHFFCPHCHGQMRSPTPCPDCGAAMVPMLVRGGGMVEICSRRGCRSHMLDLAGVNF